MREQETGDQIQYLLGDINTRLRDLEERNRIIRERVLLLGKNLISTRQETEDEIKLLKKDGQEIKKDISKIKRIVENLLVDFEKFVKREEVMIIERMLKDFQPLEFVRKKDIEELIEEKIRANKQKSEKNKNTESLE